MTDTPTTIELAPAVLEAFPELAVEFLLIENRLYDDPLQADAHAARVVERAREAHGHAGALGESVADGCYRSFYRAMGLKAAQVSTPVKQAKRVLANGTYRPISHVVDLAMEIEYATLISFQAYDAKSLAGSLTYRLADGDEPITTIRGEAKICKPGEVILVSGNRAAHSCYYGNSAEFLLQPRSSLALLRVMRVPGMPAEKFDAAADEACKRLAAVGRVRVDCDCTVAELGAL